VKRSGVKRMVLALLFCGALVFAQESGAKKESAEPNQTWLWINFIVLAAGLGYLMGKSLPRFFKSRTQGIQKDIVDAQQTRKLAEERAAAIERRVSALGAEVEAFQARAHSEMEQEGARIATETSRLIAKVREQAEFEIEAAAKAARRELGAYAAKLSVDLAEQRIRARLNEDTASGLVTDFVHDLETEEFKN